MGRVELANKRWRRAPSPIRVLLALIGCVAVAAPAADEPRDRVRQALAAACEDPSAPLAEMADRIPGARGTAAEPLVVRGIEAGWKRRFELPSGAVLRVERFIPRGQLRCVAVEYSRVGGQVLFLPERCSVAELTGQAWRLM